MTRTPGHTAAGPTTERRGKMSARWNRAFIVLLGLSVATMALSINFFRPVWQTRLRAEARVVNRGKNVGYVECDVTDQDGKRVAKASSTCVVLRGEHASPR